jgi:flagellar motor protein MotB
VVATAYEVRVAAVNARGTGAFTATASATPASAPGVPQSVAVVGKPGALAVTWAAPADTGGAAVTDYLLEYSVAGSASWSPWPTGSAATAATVTGLRPATSYDVRVSAINTAGAGPVSAAVRATVPASTTTVRPVIRALPSRVRTLTGARLLATPGTPAAALMTRTPSTCVTRNGRVLFLDRPGTCRLVVVQRSTVIRHLSTVVVRGRAPASSLVTPQRTLTTQFVGNSAQISPRSRTSLRVAAPMLRRAAAVAVYGYSASSTPGVSTTFANRLSLARARAVATFLRARGVTVIVAVGYGGSHPVAGGAQANRRAVTGWLR